MRLITIAAIKSFIVVLKHSFWWNDNRKFLMKVEIISLKIGQKVKE
jgi:hypothetical protein